jgi:choline dehydrogenase-like flavoprotein
MLHEFQDVIEGEPLRADICIVGAGAAGLCMGRMFAQSNIKVCILESGGLVYEQKTQDLYHGVDEVLPVQPGITRLRYFGGTTNHWEGQCTPLNAIDFKQRPWVENSGWPLTYGDLLPYYRNAQQICGLGDFEYRSIIWSLLDDKEVLFNKDKLDTFFLQLSPPEYRFFGQALLEEAKSWPNVNIYLHANVVNILTNDTDSRVKNLVAASLEGERRVVYAKKYVLAAGAIANARIMLYSNTVNKNGIGNKFDNVGRYFMQHPHVNFAEIVPSDDAGKKTLHALIGGKNLPEEKYNGVVAQVGIKLTPSEQEKEKVLNSSMQCGFGVPLNSPEQVFVSMSKRLKRGQMPDKAAEKAWYLLKNAGKVLKFLPEAIEEGADSALRHRGSDAILVQARLEQSPNRESRILLSDDRDALDLPGLRTQWQLNELDRRSFKVMASKLGAEIGRLEIGRLRLAEWFQNFDTTDNSPENWSPNMWGGFHHMGTTRMSNDPRTGVVDGNCRVHGIDNLYVAGSSIFSTSGHANPTLTLLAFAFRLAEHLIEKN